MTAKERAEKCVVEGLLRDYGGWTGSAASTAAIRYAIEAAILEERSRWQPILSDLSMWLASGMGDANTTPEQYEQRIRLGVDASVATEVKREREACATILEEQNKMVNELFDNPGRHDAFARDVAAAIRKRGTP